jgi:HEAT repeat protein
MTADTILSAVRKPDADSASLWREASYQELAGALLAARDETEIAGLCDWIGRRLDDRLVPALLPLLAHDSGRVRAAASEALGQIGSTTAGPALATALTFETDLAVLPTVVSACGTCRARDALPILVRVLQDTLNSPGEVILRRSIAQALAYLGRDQASLVRPAIRNALEVEGDAYARELFERALASLDPPSPPWPDNPVAWRGSGCGVEIWYLATDDGQRVTMFDDGTLLGPGFYRVGTDFQGSAPARTPVVAELLESLQSAAGRQKVIRRILAVIDEPNFLDLLSSLEPSPLLRAIAIRAFALDALEAPHPALIELLRAPHPRLRGEAFSALAMLGEGPEEPGLAASLKAALLSEREPSTLQRMMASVGASPFAELASDVAAYLDSPDPVVRYGAAASLARWGAAGQRERLYEATTRENWAPAKAAMEQALS